MFDANAAHIKEGELFFAEVHSVSEELHDKGVMKGSIILCEHVKKEGFISEEWKQKALDFLGGEWIENV